MWLHGKESAWQRRGCRRCGFNPWVGKIPWSRKWQLTPVFLPGKSHGQRSLAGYNPGGSKRVRHNWATKSTQTRTHLSSHISSAFKQYVSSTSVNLVKSPSGHPTSELGILQCLWCTSVWIHILFCCFKDYFLLEYNCFKMLCKFLLYNRVTRLHVCIHVCPPFFDILRI